jgi:hypothetical protein
MRNQLQNRYFIILAGILQFIIHNHYKNGGNYEINF